MISLTDTRLIESHTRHCRAQGFSPITIRDRQQVLRRVAEALPGGLCAYTEELEEWLGGPGWKPWTQYTYYSHLSAFYSWAAESGALVDEHQRPYNPMRGIKRPKTPNDMPRTLTDEQLTRILAVAPAPLDLAILLAAHAGLRAAEAAGLNREDVTASTILVRGKGDKERMVPTTAQLWERIRDLPSGPVIRDARGDPYPPKILSRKVALVFDRANMSAVTMHWARHWFGTTLLGRGADIRTVQELLGHASVVTTQRYTHVSDGQRRAAIATLPSI